VAIDDDPGKGLADAGDGEKHRHQETGLGIAETEVRHQQRKQRR
jgi:hypothetical protein